MNWLLNLLQSGSSVASNMADNVMGSLKKGFGFIADQVSKHGKTIGNALGVFGAVISTGANIILGVFRGAASLLMTGLKVFLGVLTGIIGGLKLVVSQTEKLAKDIAAIRNSTGLSIGQSANLSFRSRGLGIGADDLNSIVSNPANNPALFAQRSAALGVGGGFESEGFFQRLAAQYQSTASQGPMGRLVANQQLDMLFGGSAPDSVRRVANMSPAAIGAQENFVSGAAASVGLDPEKLRQYAEDLPLLTARASVLFELLKVKLAEEVLPAVLKFADGFSSFLSGNIDNVVNGIKVIGQWLTNVFPQLLISTAQIGTKAFLFVAQGVVTLLKILEDSNSGLTQFALLIAGAVDLFVTGIKSAITVFGFLGSAIQDVAAVISFVMQTSFKSVASLLKNLKYVPGINKIPGVKKASEFFEEQLSAPSWIPFKSLTDSNKIADAIPQTDLAGIALNAQSALSQAGLSNDWQKKIDGWQDNTTSFFDNIQSGFDGFKDAQNKTNEKLDVTNATLRSIDNKTSPSTGAMASTVARLASYQIIDSYEFAMR